MQKALFFSCIFGYLVHQHEKPLFLFVFFVILVFWVLGEWNLWRALLHHPPGPGHPSSLIRTLANQTKQNT